MEYLIYFAIDFFAIALAILFIRPFEDPYSAWVVNKLPSLRSHQTKTGTLEQLRKLSSLLEKKKKKGRIRKYEKLQKTIKELQQELEKERQNKENPDGL